jgi:sulfur transfer protein SufE
VKTATLDELVDDFEFLDAWEDRYRYIIELGDALEKMPETLKTEQNRVLGCVSNVWLVLNVEPAIRRGFSSSLTATRKSFAAWWRSC